MHINFGDELHLKWWAGECGKFCDDILRRSSCVIASSPPRLSRDDYNNGGGMDERRKFKYLTVIRVIYNYGPNYLWSSGEEQL